MKFLTAKIWLTIGVLTIIASLSFALFKIYQAYVYTKSVETPDTATLIVFIDAAIVSSVFIGVGSIFVGIGLIQYVNQKKKSQTV